MKTKNLIRVSVAAIVISSAAVTQAQVPSAPTPTIWRFMGIPQGFQRIRDATINRRGNFPRLERKDPLKRLADPANLESDNPAIKKAAEIKAAEDMKDQKIKAIKYLAKMGCGCYDKEGEITDALLAAMDDCTPDVRVAAIEAIEDAADGECCTKCGSTSCCSEKVTKRLSEIAYERDDTGCPLEPSSEVREAAAKALKACCPNRATGPIEEDTPEPLPVPPDPIRGEGESGVQGIEGEGGTGVEMIETGEATGTSDDDENEDDTEASASDVSVDAEAGPANLSLFQAAKTEVEPKPALEIEPKVEEPAPIELPKVETAEVAVEAKPAPEAQVKTKSDVDVGEVRMIGGMAIQPVTISPVTATKDESVSETPVKPAATGVSLSLSDDGAELRNPQDNNAAATEAAKPAIEMPAAAQPVATEKKAIPAPIALPVFDAKPAMKTVAPLKPVQQKKSIATVVGVDQRTGRVILRSGQAMRAGGSVAVYHQYLTGERLIAHLLIKSVNGNQAVAQATDASGLIKIETGDRAVCF